jgi:glycosyltransferase involved in cell wall biosynthesis
MSRPVESFPLFSVITPTHNCIVKLPPTSQSVLSQSQGSDLFEYILSDGDSTDGTNHWINKLSSEDHRVRAWSEPDFGIYDAMNKAIVRARGKFLYFLGAGDILLPDVLLAVAQVVQRKNINSKSLMCYGNVIWGDKGRYGGRFTRMRLVNQNICHQAVFYDRRIFEHHGLFDSNYRICADYEFNMRCFADSNIQKVYLNFDIALYEGTGVSQFGDKTFQQAFPALIRQHLGLWPLLYFRRHAFLSLRAIIRAIRNRF